MDSLTSVALVQCLHDRAAQDPRREGLEVIRFGVIASFIRSQAGAREDSRADFNRGRISQSSS